jgi:DNA polymerase alpha subunit A
LNQNNKLNGATNNLITQQRLFTVCLGHLLCDIMSSSKELLTKCKSYDLLDLAQFILYKNIDEQTILDRNLEEEKQAANYYNSSNLLMKYLGLAMTDANYIMKISNDLQCLQLAYQITCIAGNVLSRTLIGGRSERNEFLLLHAFYDKDFILPDKYKGYRKQQKQQKTTNNSNKSTVKVELKLELEDDDNEDETRMITATATQLEDDTENKNSKGVVSKSNGYTGGLVLEPKVGFYDRFILLLDFNSLYPSIIQEYNICFTTINRPFSDLAETDIDDVKTSFNLVYNFSLIVNFCVLF